MQNFIVLGLVPGTNIQLGFGFWLLVAGGLTVLLFMPRIVRAVALMHRQWVARQVARQIDRLDLVTL